MCNYQFVMSLTCISAVTGSIDRLVGRNPAGLYGLYSSIIQMAQWGSSTINNIPHNKSTGKVNCHLNGILQIVKV